MAYLIFGLQILTVGAMVMWAIRSQNLLKARLRKGQSHMDACLDLADRMGEAPGPVSARAAGAIVRGLMGLHQARQMPWWVGENAPQEHLHDRPGAPSYASLAIEKLGAAERAAAAGDVMPACELAEVMYAIRNALPAGLAAQRLDTAIRRLGSFLEKDMKAEVSVVQPGDTVAAERCEVVQGGSGGGSIRMVHGIYCRNDIVTVQAKVST